MLAKREQLARHLYSALDRAPHGVVALRIGHPDGLSWRVQDDVLSVWAGKDHLGDFGLNITFQQLAAQLDAAGVVVKYTNPDMLTLSAASLLDGAGSEASSNGDQLLAFTSTLWVFLDAYASELTAAERQIIEATAQLYIGSAEGDFLDLWGSYFGVHRLSGEQDSEYRTRIIVETLRPKSNKIALEIAATAVAGERIDIYEPWTDLFWLSESRLDHHRMFDGDEWSPYVFRPIARGQQPIKWDRVTATLEKLRPAGVLMLPPEWMAPARGIGVDVRGLGCTREGSAYFSARYNDRMLLSDYLLDDETIKNYRIVHFSLFGKGNAAGMQEYLDRLSARRTFVRAQIVLSDMDEPLGHERCRFPMSMVGATNTPRLGEFALSGFNTGFYAEPVEDVFIHLMSRGAESDWRRVSMGCLLSSSLVEHVYADDSMRVSGGLRLSEQVVREPALITIDVVTAYSLSVSPTYFIDLPTWRGEWGNVTWNEVREISGILINVTTETI